MDQKEMLNRWGRFTRERRLERGHNNLQRHKLWALNQPDISLAPLTSAIHANVDEMGPTSVENGTFWRPPDLASAKPGPAGCCHLPVPHTLGSLWAPQLPRAQEGHKDWSSRQGRGLNAGVPRGPLCKALSWHSHQMKIK